MTANPCPSNQTPSISPLFNFNSLLTAPENSVQCAMDTDSKELWKQYASIGAYSYSLPVSASLQCNGQWSCYETLRQLWPPVIECTLTCHSGQDLANYLPCLLHLSRLLNQLCVQIAHLLLLFISISPPGFPACLIRSLPLQ